jgi:tetratricopeptide (TPR) repeat protein
MSARSPWAGALAIVLLAFAAHAPALRAGFLWDDEFWLWKSPLTLEDGGILRAWFSVDRWDFYPVTSTAFWILWRVFGESAAGYHAVNAALHAGGAVLVWRVLLALGVPGAWVCAALFAVHPVTVGSVAWITQLKNTLSLVFSAAAVLAWLRFDSAGAEQRRRNYWQALAAFVAALLSKASTVTLPVVMLAATWWRRGRIAASDVRAALPFLVLAAAQGAATTWFQANRVFGGEEAPGEPFVVRLAAAGRAVWFYAGQAIAPRDLAIVYPRENPDPATLLAWLPLVALAATFAAAFALRRGPGRPVLFAFVAFVALLLPVLGLVELYYSRYSRVADHWQYLALPAILALWVGGAAAALGRLGARGRTVGVAVAAAAIVAAGTLSFRQARAYRDPGTFWRTVIARNPGAWVAHNGLGTWLGHQGDHAGATTEFERAVAIRPDYPLALRNLGLAAERLGEPGRAEQAYRAALALRADYADARADLGRLLAAQGRREEAIVELRAAVAARPWHAEARHNLAVALAEGGDVAAAVAELREAVRHHPGALEARYLLAKLLVRSGDLAGAAEQLRAIVERRPDYEDAAAALRAVESALRPAG